MNSCEVKYCPNCAKNKIEHEFQDKIYGKFMRVFNNSEKTETSKCTVCGFGKKLKK